MQALSNIFGIHETALKLHGERLGVLAANLSNADTPNYKARDLDFAAVLKGEGGKAMALKATHAHHMNTAGAIAGAPAGGAEMKYRVPFQPSLDGNTVEVPIEQAAFSESAVRYQASLMFINRRIAGLESAISGQ